MHFKMARMSGVESDAWMGLVAVCELLPAALDRGLQQDVGLTHFEFSTLSALQLSSGSVMRMTALAEATDSTLPRLSHVCARLEARGLLSRQRANDDRRATDVQLTSAGRRLLIAALPDHLATARRLVLDALDESELLVLSEVTQKILERMGSPRAYNADRIDE